MSSRPLLLQVPLNVHRAALQRAGSEPSIDGCGGSCLLELDVEHLSRDPLAEVPGSHRPVNGCCDGVDGVALGEQVGDVRHPFVRHTGSFAREFRCWKWWHVASP